MIPSSSSCYPARPFSCPHPGCGKAYLKLGKLNRHLAVHSPVPAHVCPHPGCAKAFHRADHLRVHVLCHTQERAYACPRPLCGASFLTSAHLSGHLRSHDHNAHPCSVEGCAESFSKRSALRQHLHSAHAVEVSLPCPHPPCAERFGSRSLLTRHVHLTHAAARYHCGLCSLAFTRYLDFRKHQRLHEADDWTCAECGRTVKRKRKRDHERTHEQRTFSCDREGCDWEGRSRGGLRTHQRVQHADGEGRRFACELCGKRFGYRAVLQKHLRRVHPPGMPEGQRRLAPLRQRKKTEKDCAFGSMPRSDREHAWEDDDELASDDGQMDMTDIDGSAEGSAAERTPSTVAVM